MVTTGTSTPQYAPSGNAELCYDVGEFHPNCRDVTLDYPYLFCRICRCIAHVDLVGVHVTHESVGRARQYG